MSFLKVKEYVLVINLEDLQIVQHSMAEKYAESPLGAKYGDPAPSAFDFDIELGPGEDVTKLAKIMLLFAPQFSIVNQIPQIQVFDKTLPEVLAELGLTDLS